MRVKAEKRTTTGWWRIGGGQDFHTQSNGSTSSPPSLHAPASRSSVNTPVSSYVIDFRRS
jgi:hypothetical protein